MARGYSTSRSEQSTPTAVNNVDAYKKDYRSVARGSTKKLQTELDGINNKLLELQSNVTYQNAKDDLARINREYTTIEENYYGSDGMWRERVWKKDTPRDVINDYAKALRIRDKFKGAEDDLKQEASRTRSEMTKVAEAKLRLEKFFPDIPGVSRDRGGYQSIDELSKSREGRAQLSKVAAELDFFGSMNRVLAREVQEEAVLQGENRGGVIGTLEREVKIGKVMVKVQADVDYKNSPYGDSNMIIENMKFSIKPV